MATKNIVPRADNEGGIGTSIKRWLTGYITTLYSTTFDTNVTAAKVTLSGTTLAAGGTDTNVDINITPKGSGEVNLTKVDIDSGAIDGTAIGANSASTGKFTSVTTDTIAESTTDAGVTIDGITLKDGGALDITGGTNTFNLTNGTASLDVAAGKTVDINDSLTVTAGYGITLTVEDAASTITMDEANLEIEGEGTAVRLLKLKNKTDADTTVTFSGTTLDLVGGTNTFSITAGTASLDIAAGATLNIDKSLTVDGQATTITGAGQANTITLNESITIGDGYSGTLTYSAASKTLTVEGTSVVNQDLTTDASPQFTGIELGNASDTTITRVSAGQLAVEGVNILMNGGALGTPASGDLQNCTASTTSAKGVAELATNAEALEGTDTSRIVTPDDLKYVLDIRLQQYYGVSWDESADTYVRTGATAYEESMLS